MSCHRLDISAGADKLVMSVCKAAYYCCRTEFL